MKCSLNAKPLVRASIAGLLTSAIILPASAQSTGSSQSAVPTVSFVHQPDRQTTDRFARFEFVAPNADRFMCSLDGVSLGRCSSPFVLMPRKAGDPILAPGAHTFTVQASRRGVSGPPLSVSWKVVSVLEQAKVQAPGVSKLLSVDSEAAPPYLGKGGNSSYIRGIARFKCLESHVAYDDPIVYPATPGAAHLHSFWGNVEADAYSTAESLFTQGDSSCQGNTLNRSAYWVPALLAPIYATDGTRAGWQPVLKDADPRALARGLFHETYYYSAVVTRVNDIVAPPPGLRVIAGDASATHDHPAQKTVLDDPLHIARWYCAKRRGPPGRPENPTSHIPECPITKDPAGRDNMLVHYVLRFPSCWDGVNLDSADHKSHMAYVVYGTRSDGTPDRSVVQCPASHPVAIPEVSYHYSFTVTESNADPVTKTSRGWRLASDHYAVAPAPHTPFAYGGQSLHGDWFNAWHPEAIQAFIDGCLKQRKDCRNGQLGAPDSSRLNYVLGPVIQPEAVVYPPLPNTSTSGMPPGMAMRH